MKLRTGIGGIVLILFKGRFVTGLSAAGGELALDGVGAGVGLFADCRAQTGPL